MLSDIKVPPPSNVSLLCIDLWEIDSNPLDSKQQYWLCTDLFGKYDIKIDNYILQGTYDLGSKYDNKIFSDTYKWFNEQKLNSKKDTKVIDLYLESLFHHANDTFESLSSRYYDSVPGRMRLNRFFYNFNNLLILSKDSLEMVCEIHDTKNILIFGSAWEECIHHRPVGLNTLQDMDINVYVIPELVWTKNGQVHETHIVDDPLMFHRCFTKHEIYKLAKRNNEKS